MIPHQAGRIVALNEPKLQSTYQLDWLVKPGEHTQSASSNLSHAAFMFVENTDRKRLEEDFARLATLECIQYSGRRRHAS